MPRLKSDDSGSSEMQVHKIGGGNFSFSGARIDHLGATGYTLVVVAVDETGSVSGWEKELRDALVLAVESCKNSPRSDNLLLRVITFGSQHQNGVNEIHGFKPLVEVDATKYPAIRPGGMTPLCDACYSSIGSINTYGEQLVNDGYGVNAIAFIITDGGENASTATMQMVREEARKSVAGETVESLISVLIGVNAKECSRALQTFKDEAGITQFVDAGEATKGKLAKLAQFVSQSVSSQAQMQGSGGPSQNIATTI